MTREFWYMVEVHFSVVGLMVNHYHDEGTLEAVVAGAAADAVAVAAELGLGRPPPFASLSSFSRCLVSSASYHFSNF